MEKKTLEASSNKKSRSVICPDANSARLSSEIQHSAKDGRARCALDFFPYLIVLIYFNLFFLVGAADSERRWKCCSPPGGEEETLENTLQTALASFT